ncbi:hypothetical protein DBR32_15545 [Taibaiella sp. KBW10]|uniref:hypothetical protein n=1 Tax=Taibaiella sp. KBW10 TaxID=2153357 RepID=UPI000F5A0AE9|nr:hypothetical protein [Taibaiella sp. KBW10]RQO29671.1 hypothetical protein DBR32_15545 [Taibaiella sp. KBW10]
MADVLTLRGENGKLYQIPSDQAAQYVLSNEQADQVFSKNNVKQVQADQLPDFGVLLQMEYAD